MGTRFREERDAWRDAYNKLWMRHVGDPLADRIAAHFGATKRQDGLTDQVRDAPLPWLPDREEIARVIDLIETLRERVALGKTCGAATDHPLNIYHLAERAADALALLSRPSEGGTVSVDESGSSPAAPVKSEGACKSEGLDTPLPCDVTVAHMTFRAGVKLRTFVNAAARWHAKATEGDALTERSLTSLCKSEGGWLIEGEMPDGSPGWMTIRPTEALWGVVLTKDSTAALRFCRRQDAEDYFAAHIDEGPFRITAHEWR